MDTSTTVSIITSSEEQHTRHMITQPPSARHSPGTGLWATLNVEETGLTRVALRVEAEAGDSMWSRASAASNVLSKHTMS